VCSGLAGVALPRSGAAEEIDGAYSGGRWIKAPTVSRSLLDKGA